LKTKHQIAIDHLIIRPFAFLLNFAVRIMGKITSIDHRLDKDFEKIVICKFKGLGSIIQSTPMVEAFRKSYPNAEIIYLSTQSNRALLEKIEHIDTIYTIDDSSIFKLIRTLTKIQIQLLRKRPDIFIDLEIYSNFSTIVGVFSLSKNRIGYYLRSSSFKMGIYTHMMFFNSTLPISEVYFQLFRLFKKEFPKPNLYPLKSTSSIELPEKYVVINPNASDLRIERRWDINNFKSIVEFLLSNSYYSVVLIGSKGEKEYTDQLLKNHSSERLISLAGKTSMDELIKVIEKADLMITNDTGPMHIAFATGVSTICLFGPCSPQQYGNFNNTKVFYKKAYCSPCVHDFNIPPCMGNNVCMKMIEVEEVKKSISDFIKNGKLDNIDSITIAYEIPNTVLGLVNRDAIKKFNEN